MMKIAILIVFGLLGLSFGSFANVLIYRLPRGESPWRGRSHCPACHARLAWIDLVPIVSFLWLRGRCRYCQGKISWQYPLVELGGMMLFLAGGVLLLPLLGV